MRIDAHIVIIQITRIIFTNYLLFTILLRNPGIVIYFKELNHFLYLMICLLD